MPRYLFPVRVRPDTISGGVRTIFRHAAWLKEAGFDAAVVNAFGHPSSFVSGAEVLSDANLQVAAGDIVTLPESFGSATKRLLAPGCRTQVFCQNHHYVFRALGGARDYAAIGIAGVYSSSRTIAEFLVRAALVPASPVVPYAVDPALFHPEPKTLQIAVMPRKLPEQAGFIERAFKARHPRLASLPWIVIEGMNEEQTAAVLRRSAVFLHLGWREGFGLPALEAMACGTAVVGFAGGAFDLPRPQNGRWFHADDAVACADGLAAVVAGLANGDAELRAMLVAGLATASGYSLHRARSALIERFRALA